MREAPYPEFPDFDDDRLLIDGEPSASRAQAILARWEHTRTGACLDDAQEDLAEHLATVIDIYLSDDHDSIADVRAVVAEHVDLDDFPDVTPHTFGRVVEQLTIAADGVVVAQREPRQLEAVRREASEARAEYEWLMESGYYPPHLHKRSPLEHLVAWLDWLEDRPVLELTFSILIMPVLTILVLTALALGDLI